MQDYEQSLVLQALGDLRHKSDGLEKRLARVEKLLNMPMEEPTPQQAPNPVATNAPASPAVASPIGAIPIAAPVEPAGAIPPRPASAPLVPVAPKPITVTPTSALPPASTMGRLPEVTATATVSTLTAAAQGAVRNVSETQGPVIIPAPVPSKVLPTALPVTSTAVAASAPRPKPVKEGLSLGDWEKIIGGQWALWLGCLSIFLAVASFLAYTWTKHPPAPWLRVVMGLSMGAAMMGAGGYFRPKVARWWSEGLLGSGLAVCYMSLWAAGPYFRILSFEATFISMASLTALGVMLALYFDSGELALLSVLGGFATPLLLSQYGPGYDYSLLIYLSVLNGGIVGVSLFKRWRPLVWVAFASTLFLVTGWYFNAVSSWAGASEAIAWPLFGFLTLYFLMFAAAACFYSVYREETTASQDLGLLFIASGIYSVSAYFLITSHLGHYPGLFPLGLAWFYGALAVLLPRNRTLRESLAGLGLLALTVAFPIQFGGSALLVGWTMEAAVLLVLARRLELPNFRRAGQIVWLLKWIPFVSQVIGLSWTHHAQLPFFNTNALSMAFALGVSLFLAVEARDDENREKGDGLARSYAASAVLGGAYLVLQETYLWLANTHFLLFGLVIAEMLFAVAAFRIGLQVRLLVVRVCSLFLLGGAIASLVALANYKEAWIWMPFLNLRCVASLVAIAAVWAVWFLIRRKEALLSGAEVQSREFWQLLGAGLPLLALSQELYFALPYLCSQSGFTFFALSALWALYSTFLLSVAFSSSTLRALASTIFSVAGAVLLLTALMVGFDGVPGFNVRLGAFVITIGCCFTNAWTSYRQRERLNSGESEGPGLLFFTGLLLVLWAMTQETIHLAHHMGHHLSPEPYQWALRTISLIWSLYAALLLEVGLNRRIASVATGLRWLAYVIGLGGLSELLWHSIQVEEMGWPFFNGLVATFVATIALWFWANHRLYSHQDELDVTERTCPTVVLFGGISLLLWLFTQETIYTSHYLARGDQWALRTIALVWTVFAAALLQLGLLPNPHPASAGLRRMAYLVGIGGVCALLWNALAVAVGGTPFFNGRAATFAVTIGLWFWSARSLYQHRERLSKAEFVLSHVSLFGGLGLFLWFLTQETLNTSRALSGASSDRWGQMAISLVWSLFGAGLLGSGIAKRFQPLRLAGLGLLSITAVKVFVFDLPLPDGLSRMFSLGGLGLSLVFISWLYSRFAVERENENTPSESTSANDTDNTGGVGNGPHIGHGRPAL